MLRIKRVELQGFKSFCDKTELRFNGWGIAAIVGPNGCGKSNLSDAISWVLGEQSARTLRGMKMQDIIFAGTRDRKPVSMASVSITLVDPDGDVLGKMAAEATPFAEQKTAPHSGEALCIEEISGTGKSSNGSGQANGAAGTNGANGKNGVQKRDAASLKGREITITRRLYRSGESEYLIDGKQARLRDIQELFMGTGLGPESYAIIEQGRIGQILSSKPMDRRAVIEEAAGITRFKSRRKLAEAKLEGAKQNLARVFDILEEVGRQVNSLKRQAAKARRAEEIRTEMTARLRTVLASRFRMLEREATKIALDLNVAAQELQSLQAEVKEGEEGYTALQAGCYATESQLTAARSRLSELHLEAERARSRRDFQARQIESLAAREEQSRQEITGIETRLAALAEELSAQEATAEQAARALEESRSRLGIKETEREQLQAELGERQQALDAARREALRLMGEVSQFKNQLAQIETFLESLERDLARTKREEEAAGAELERTEARRQEAASALADCQLRLETLAAERSAVEQNLQDRKGRALETRRRLDQQRAEYSRLKARKDSLEEILSHRAYTTETVKRLFTAVDRGRAQAIQPVGVLADFVEVTRPDYEKAAEEFLHDELEYVVVKDWSAAEEGIRFLRTDLEGRATFLVEPQAAAGVSGECPWPAPTEPPLGPETGIAGRLSDVVRFTNGLTRAPAALLPRLNRCFLAEDEESARRLAERCPDFYFLLSDGVCYHGLAVTGGKNRATGPLALKRELRELTGQVQAQEQALEAMTGELESLEEEVQSLTASLERLRAEQQDLEKQAAGLKELLRGLEQEAERARRRVEVARLELGRITQETGAARAQREEKLNLLSSKEGELRAHEAAFEESRAVAEELQRQAAVLAEEHASLRAEVASLEERRRAVAAARERLVAQRAELERRKQSLAEGIGHSGAERSRLEEENQQLARALVKFDEELAATQERVQELARIEAEQRRQLAGIEEGLKALRGRAAEALERRSQIELELVRKQAELKYLDENSRKELGVAAAELAEAEETVLDEAALEEAEASYQELKRRLEALGPVNPAALEEHEEAQQRYEFLNAQRQDLLDSIRDTERAIQEIDTESRKRFQEAFRAINESFGELFSQLFGGGSAEMRLSEPENELESGIDIMASPPGKKLQSVLLLSGGEKALTALALLMAVFRYQPSPFCILDEVDAPLDEANVGRFLRLVDQMSEQTQFILITHAKRTMEAAEVLYGVTMQEPGISQVVSVRFNGLGSPGPKMEGARQRLQFAPRA